MEDLTIFEQSFLTYIFLMLRYLFFSGLAFLLFYIWKKRSWLHLKIQKQFPKRKKIHQEIKYSILSIFIFGAVSIFITMMKKAGYTLIYKDLFEYGWLYLVFSLPLLLLIHDTYFYWIHRMMHHPKIFKYVHAVHHHSHNPSPWAAFSFHPLEAIIEAAIFLIIVFIVPINIGVLLVFLVLSQSMNVLGHLGYEIFPKGFVKHPIGKWLNTSTHHNMHHKYSHANYSLYFNIWDRIMKTNHKNYESFYENRKVD